MSDDLFIDGGDPLDDPHWQKTKTTKLRRSGRHMGCPLPWFVWVFPLVQSKEQLGLAFYLYRRCCICRSDTVTVPNNEIRDLMDVSRFGKCRMLKSMEEAGILRIEENGRQTTKVRLCHWPDPPPQ
jgi:hypothetical protein